jgi:hypothetical protein
MSAKRLEPVTIPDRGGECSRDEDFAAKRLAQRFDPRDLIHSGPDDGKVEAIDSADIAVQHLTEMESKVDRGERLPHPHTIGVESVESIHCGGGRIKRTITGFSASRVDKSEAREHTVAKELEHLSAVRTQRGRQGLEYVIEHFNKNGTRRRVG